MPVVTVIDYGIGNLLSVARAFEQCGASVVLTDNPKQIAGADYLVLPGVGAFADGMLGLRQRNLIESIKKFSSKDRPFLGICLGMQMMLSTSEEFGNHEGLNLIRGKVTVIPSTDITGAPHKIPHIGWNFLQFPPAISSWENSILANTLPGTAVYFVHSFTAVPDSPSNRLADCLYNGRFISAAIRSGNLYGCQFHPEKSGECGLKIIDTFLNL
jgi:imidazole glycerol-phosphate synthase subunit HisH